MSITRHWIRLGTILTGGLGFACVAGWSLAACGHVDDAAAVDAGTDAKDASAIESSSDVVSESSADAADSFDAATDVVVDSPTYSVDDYGSFRWYWYGTGSGADFWMDRDCGVDARESYGSYVGKGTGVVAPDDCLAFMKLTTSKTVTSALATPGRCGDCCDDYGDMTLTLVDGGKIVKSIDACQFVEPFKTLELEMRRLGKLYAYPDAGTD